MLEWKIQWIFFELENSGEKNRLINKPTNRSDHIFLRFWRADVTTNWKMPQMSRKLQKNEAEKFGRKSSCAKWLFWSKLFLITRKTPLREWRLFEKRIFRSRRVSSFKNVDFFEFLGGENFFTLFDEIIFFRASIFRFSGDFFLFIVTPIVTCFFTHSESE